MRIRPLRFLGLLPLLALACSQPQPRRSARLVHGQTLLPASAAALASVTEKRFQDQVQRPDLAKELRQDLLEALEDWAQVSVPEGLDLAWADGVWDDLAKDASGQASFPESLAPLPGQGPRLLLRLRVLQDSKTLHGWKVAGGITAMAAGTLTDVDYSGSLRADWALVLAGGRVGAWGRRDARGPAGGEAWQGFVEGLMDEIRAQAR